MSAYEELINQLRLLGTEQVNPETLYIDRLSSLEIVQKINAEDAKVALVVKTALPQISRAAEYFANTIKNKGRIFYIGAGTSGRLGVLDASECPPTFGTDPDLVIGVIAGGDASLRLSREGAEDKTEAAVKDLQTHNITKNDFVIGIAASTRTPYTLSGLEYAQSIGCKTAFIICNPKGEMKLNPDVLIELPVGPEAISGSTRMKSGTAQKMTLNMISTTAMVLLGKTYGNLMIDLQARSEKLAARSRKILMDLLEIPIGEAENLLQSADGSVKIGIVMYKFSCTKQDALEKLNDADGFISRIS